VCQDLLASAIEQAVWRIEREQFVHSFIIWCGYSSCECTIDRIENGQGFWRSEKER
jgi:hypothetical protein